MVGFNTVMEIMDHVLDAAFSVLIAVCGFLIFYVYL